MPTKELIFALHGFLGESADWNEIKNSFSQNSEVEFKCHNLFTPLSPEIEDFESYARNFEFSDTKYNKKIFIGYSLGGRIGLALLKTNPELFDHYIFLSTNPGLPETQLKERKLRIDSDQQWADQISEVNWTDFLKKWNSQKVFEFSKQEPQKDFKNFDILKLKQALSLWSLGLQTDYSETIKKYQHKITWVVGEQDSKYLQMAEDLKQKKILLDYKRIFSGHRIGLDQPQAIIKLLHDLL